MKPTQSEPDLRELRASRADAGVADNAPSASRRVARSVSWQLIVTKYGLIIAWLIEIAVLSIFLPDTFATTGNWQVMLGGQAALLVLTLGVLIPLSAGEFDFSMPGVFSCTVVIVGYLNVIKGIGVGLAVLVALAFAFAVAMMHIVLIVRLGVQSLVVTLGSATLLSGLALAIQSQSIAGISEKLVVLARTQILGIQSYFWWAFALTIILWYVFSHTPFGRYLYFTGAAREVARLSGVRVDQVRAIALLCGTMIAAVAGVLFAGLLGSADPRVGSAFLLPIFASAYLGATVITPGRFNPWGSFVAVYFLVTGITGLELAGLSGWIEQVFYGTALIIAVTLARLSSARQAGE